MSLAEELLADLEEEDEEMDDELIKKEEEAEFVDEVIEEKPLPNMTKYERVTDVAKLTSTAE
jgi:hypothetical protein